MFLLLKYQKLLTFLIKNPKKKLSRFSPCFYMESPNIKNIRKNKVTPHTQMFAVRRGQVRIQAIDNPHEVVLKYVPFGN